MILDSKRLLLLSSVRLKKLSLLRSLLPLLCFSEADENTAVLIQDEGTAVPFFCRVHRDRDVLKISTCKENFFPSFFLIFEGTFLSLAFFPSWLVGHFDKGSSYVAQHPKDMIVSTTMPNSIFF